MPSGLLPESEGDRIFSHFTNAEGVIGITGIDGKKMQLNEQVFVNELRFGFGENSFLSS